MRRARRQCEAPRMPRPQTEKVLISPTGGLHASRIHVFRLNSARTTDRDESSEASAIGPRYNQNTAVPRISRPRFWKSHASQFADGQPSRKSHVSNRLPSIGAPTHASDSEEWRRLRLGRLEDRSSRSVACGQSHAYRRRWKWQWQWQWRWRIPRTKNYHLLVLREDLSRSRPDGRRTGRCLHLHELHRSLPEHLPPRTPTSR